VTNIYYPGTGLLNTVTGTPSGGSAVEYAKCTKYAPTGKIGKITHAYNNTKTEYTYDAKTTRLTTLKTSGPAPENVTIQSKSYTYYEAGDIHTITDKLVTPNIIYTYQYDNLHRLTEETTSDNTLPTDADIMIYNYNDSEHINAVTSIDYNGTDYGFTYDSNGNMKSGYDFTNPASIVQRGITWNADNMPVTVTRGSTTTDITYDGDGVRAKKIAGGITTYYVSNDYEIKDGAATKYIFAGNMRVAEVEDTTSTIFHKDHLGSSTAMTNNIGINIESTEYLPFGGMRSHTGLDISDFKFIDQEVDISSNLYNYDARLYDPVIGRFISADSVEQDWFNPQNLNRYTYCLNNPLKYEDPDGHFVFIFAFIFGGAIIYEWLKPDPANAPENYEQAQTAQESSTGLSNAINGGLIGASVGGAVRQGIGKGLTELGKETVEDITGIPTDIGDVGKITTDLADPKTIRFTQDSIGSSFKDGRKVRSLVDDLKAGKTTAGDVPPIRVFEKDGKIFTLDNRRLKAFQEAGIPIRTIKATPKEIANESWKMTTKTDGLTTKVR
jgi:RHS repeat-associated protein